MTKLDFFTLVLCAYDKFVKLFDFEIHSWNMVRLNFLKFKILRIQNSQFNNTKTKTLNFHK